MGFSSLDQLSCDNHLFFKGLHALTMNTKAFYKNVLSSEWDIFEVCKIKWERLGLWEFGGCQT